jgi:hypothetical protein
MVCGKTPQHEADHGEPDQGGSFAGVSFVVARQTPVAADPCQSALDGPTFWQHHETRQV